MTGTKRAGLHDDGDTPLNFSGNPHIDDIVAARGSRRQVLGGMAALAGLFSLSAGTRSEAAVVATGGSVPGPMLGFTAVAKSLEDRVIVPEGYSVSVLYALGDPLAPDVAAPRNDGSDTDYARRSGDCHDGMHFFGLSAAGQRDDTASGRGLLCINHEYVIEEYLHAHGGLTVVDGSRTLRGEVDKEIDCHGVSVVEVAGTPEGGWRYEPASALNRRITPNTPMAIHGPARGADGMRTLYSPTGVAGRGTVNNCANGYAAWGSYLTCEENWAGYFNRAEGDDGNRPANVVQAFARYGVPSGRASGLNWGTLAVADPAETRYRRWDASAGVDQPADGTGDFRNEPNQFGWVVEIDPYDPTSTPRKRTALGRIAHEGAWPADFVVGRPPVYYMGDDSRGEYFYKFVSATPWDPADAGQADRLAVGDKYLDEGTLYVARFDATGAGVWLPLVFGDGGLTANNALYPFEDQADVLIHARLAADAVGATRMDRPEWAAVNPANGEVYLTLTNGNARSRPAEGTDAANPRHYNDPRGPENTAQRGNPNGHIIRLRENGDDPAGTGFAWDIYLFGAGSDLDRDTINLSGLDATNDFASPDGLAFARATNPAGQVHPLLWIQTDDGSFTDRTNNQMLAALPGRVGDGGVREIVNTDASGGRHHQTTRVGAAPGPMLKRFLVGPRGCEITGIDSTPDGRTVFVNIQHPGQGGSALDPRSHWPASQKGVSTALPRSATIVITRNDGGVVGL
jgi:secreted PhoX family phosphatase